MSESALDWIGHSVMRCGTSYEAGIVHERERIIKDLEKLIALRSSEYLLDQITRVILNQLIQRIKGETE